MIFICTRAVSVLPLVSVISYGKLTGHIYHGLGTKLMAHVEDIFIVHHETGIFWTVPEITATQLIDVIVRIDQLVATSFASKFIGVIVHVVV